MRKKTLLMVVAVLLLAVPTVADWDPGDGHKMHFPQLPDVDGWDIAWSTNLADDWRCSETGPVNDIHFWFSAINDDPSVIDQIAGISVAIRSDDRSGLHSKPGDFLWGQFFPNEMLTIRQYGVGDQGWYDPLVGLVIPNDHQLIFQANIVDIIQPFIQEVGTIYWLDLYVQDHAGGPVSNLGWKTSLDHFEDDAVYWNGQEYIELFDPIVQPTFSLDMAFVITPEPATLSLLALGGLAMMRRKRK